MSIEIAFRATPGCIVSRTELEAFIAHLHDMSIEGVQAYIDFEDGDAIVLEARQDPSVKGPADPSGEG